jgi:tetratricopeptide (TPR) repeat protein
MTFRARWLGMAGLVWWLFAAGATLRLALAETLFLQPDAATSRRAAFAGNARYFELWAQLALDPRAELRAAIALNPYQSAAWLALGLAFERERDLGEASRALAQASRVDRQYLPAWTEANFAFRSADAAHFWYAARRAAALAYDDLRPLLDLASHLEPDPLVALDRLGDSARLERAYLDFLIGKGRLDAAQAVASRLVDRHDPADRARVLDLTNRLAAGGRD